VVDEVDTCYVLHHHQLRMWLWRCLFSEVVDRVVACSTSTSMCVVVVGVFSIGVNG